MISFRLYLENKLQGILENPSSRDICLSISRERPLKGIIDGRDNLYIWDMEKVEDAPESVAGENHGTVASKLKVGIKAAFDLYQKNGFILLIPSSWSGVSENKTLAVARQHPVLNLVLKSKCTS